MLDSLFFREKALLNICQFEIMQVDVVDQRNDVGVLFWKSIENNADQFLLSDGILRVLHDFVPLEFDLFDGTEKLEHVLISLLHRIKGSSKRNLARSCLPVEGLFKMFPHFECGIELHHVAKEISWDCFRDD